MEIVERTLDVPAAVLSQFPPNVLRYLAVLPSARSKAAALRAVGVTARARAAWLYARPWSGAFRQAEGSVQRYAVDVARALISASSGAVAWRIIAMADPRDEQGISIPHSKLTDRELDRALRASVVVMKAAGILQDKPKPPPGPDSEYGGIRVMAWERFRAQRELEVQNGAGATRPSLPPGSRDSGR